MALVIFIGWALLLQANSTHYQKPEIATTTPNVIVIQTAAPHDMIEVVNYAMTLAEEHDVPYELVEYIVKHESNWYPYALGDLHINCKKTGKAVTARGLLQITSCYHPQVTNEQAFDPYWSLAWGVPQMADPTQCQRLWTTCKWWYSK